MTALVVRDDLSRRRALSKSTLTGFDICPTKAWHDIHHRMPLIPDERLTFGSAVDAAVEAAVKYLRAEQQIDEAVCMAAAQEVITRDGVDVDILDVERALDGWVVSVAPNYDFRLCRTQAHVSGEHEDLGEIDGHPDIVLADGRVFDVKTSKRAKAEDWTVELGFYAFLIAHVEGTPVPAVGYWTFVRVMRPYWQVLEWPVTDEMLRWTVEKAAAYIRAKRADAAMNAKAPTPTNWSMTGGPSFPAACQTCQYSAICSIAKKGASDDAA